MKTTYGKSEAGYGVSRTRRKTGRHRPAHSMEMDSREKRRLAQLLVCLVLFAVVLVGKGVFPQKAEVWQSSVQTVLHSNTDFKAAFVGLGKAISQGEPILETLGELWGEAVGGGSQHQNADVQTPLYEKELSLLAMSPQLTRQELLARQLGVQLPDGAEDAPEEAAAESSGWAERTDATQPALLDPEPKPARTEDENLPENCTTQKLSLGLGKTVTPVMGVITSGFGYRTHPVDGEYKFHYGTDVAADLGTPIYAFADGTVDFIGESPAYGQYIQLRHAGGVTTFYAHCSQLCAKKGQKVSAGDVIAKLGETGNATGPNLHIEIRLDGVFLDPAYYMNSL